jgi:proline dehydrogenase
MELLMAAKEHGARLGIATHDIPLLRRIDEKSREAGIERTAYEVQMLYGIQSEEQVRLVGEGFRVRVLISYGSYWFPWYMRRLAERPANVAFVLKHLFTR